MFLKYRICRGFLGSMVFMVGTLMAQPVVYVSPNGSDINIGNEGSPFKTIAKGLLSAGPGGTVYLRGGTYTMSGKLSLLAAGSSVGYTKLWAYPGERPIIDCTGNSSDGISISGSYYHLRGLEQMKAGHNGINISGNNNIIEHCRIHDNANTGLHLTGSGTGPSNNLILNCDSFMNYDPPIGGNADGFSTKWTVGPGNIFRGCRAWNNSDDGWDLWMGSSTVVIESCYAFRNGVDSWHSGSFAGNGNGFKLGGNYVATPQIVRNCVSFDNTGTAGRGFDENNNTAGLTVLNCLGFRNTGANFYFRNTVVAGQQHKIKNSVSYQSTVNITSGDLQANSWQGFSISADDFISMDTAQVMAPRTSGGQLPVMTFLHLAATSPLVDAGVDIGLPFSGIAPDLGAFEYHGMTSVPTNGQNPSIIRLGHNYPNPFNPSTTIPYQLLAHNHVNLRVLDLLGRELTMLVNESKPAGSYAAFWNAAGQPSGLYVYELRVGEQSLTRMMSLLR